VNQIEQKHCVLRAEMGASEFCTQARCAFWEPGGAVVEGGCAIERLGFYFLGPDVARYLLETRECLEQARDLSEAEAAHRRFARRIGLEL
jgi:hypothetical protein